MDDFEQMSSEELRRKRKQLLAEADRLTALARHITRVLVLRDIALMEREVEQARREADRKK